MICVNDKLEKKDGTTIMLADAEHYKKNNIKVPVLGTEYTIREVVLVDGNYTLLLNEIINKKIGKAGEEREPSWHYSRFSNDGIHGVLDWEFVRDIYNKQS